LEELQSLEVVEERALCDKERVRKVKTIIDLERSTPMQELS
jgi:hypothetical protein